MPLKRPIGASSSKPGPWPVKQESAQAAPPMPTFERVKTEPTGPKTSQASNDSKEQLAQHVARGQPQQAEQEQKEKGKTGKKEKKEKPSKQTVKPKRSLPGLPTSVKLELVEEDVQTPQGTVTAKAGGHEEPARDPRRRPEKDQDDEHVQVLVDPYLEVPALPEPKSTLSVEVLSQPQPQPQAVATAKQPVAKRRTRPAPKKAIVKVPPPVPGMVTTPGLSEVPQTPGPMLSQHERDRKLQEIKLLLEQQTSEVTPIPAPPLAPAPHPNSLAPPTPLTPMTPMTPATPMTPMTPSTPMTPMTPTVPMSKSASIAPRAEDDAEKRLQAYSQLLLGDDADAAEAPWKRQGKRRRVDL
ncbi:hypothetical protein AK812_SmicGene32116 [Symbiodinium microadriaticum]|uniref:Uncharacterized protein n=1 Tax=Symbiodinium microadriaticum TaxID=2951 RepID=A0A1Q9CV07_SYMMI|nr:hypothetical protein AK812_SmicGene32116 [Symbiodinium microadriaticum]